MQQSDDQFDNELATLACETRRVAESITEPAIRGRLIEISNELLELAFPRQTRP